MVIGKKNYDTIEFPLHLDIQKKDGTLYPMNPIYKEDLFFYSVN